MTDNLDTAPPTGSRPGRRVLVTGIGMITPLGGDTTSTWNGFLTGRCAIRTRRGVGAGDPNGGPGLRPVDADRGQAGPHALASSRKGDGR